MSSPLTSTMRRVLTNLYNDKPMWDGVHQVNGGAGIPSVITSLRKRGLIRHDFQLTAAGRAVAQELSQ